MDKLKKKAKLLKMLQETMMDGVKEESMEKLHSKYSEDMPMKVTVMAEDEEGLKEGVEKLPEILDKAEAFKRLRKKEKSKK